MKTPPTVNSVSRHVYCWAQPVGSRRWHVSLDGKRFVCGAFSGDRFRGNVQVMDVTADDFPVLACIKCLDGITDDQRGRGQTDE